MNSKEAVERIALWLGAQDLPVSRPAFLVHLRGWYRRKPVVVEADYFVPEGA
ncbi:hypothetical protein [Caldilinea sp.]|uniref:hypothetical protein n=1 Tax=Caldilinea sp. TaxID=2293560 RepID=UPI0021DDA877|nr:hypothetical protein [Caldilinea sp.]GIV73544.1 MAG: hypothetical protein KatS3mg049_2100 [Caldilinea sp.]